MPFTSVGYDGSVGEVEWARIARNLGAQYSVEGASDFRVSTVAGASQTVQVLAGSAYGHGVVDTNTTETIEQPLLVEADSRWDTLVIRRDWQPPGGTTALKWLTGTSQPKISVDRLNSPGVVDDQPIALVRFTAGQQVATGVIDLRCWHGDGGMTAIHPSALAYLNRLGSQVYVQVADRTYQNRLDSQQNPVWYEVGYPTEPVSVSLASVWKQDELDPFQVYKVGGEVTLKGGFRSTGSGTYSTGEASIGNLPAGFAPPTRRIFPATANLNNTWIAANVVVNTDGSVKMNLSQGTNVVQPATSFVVAVGSASWTLA